MGMSTVLRNAVDTVCRFVFAVSGFTAILTAWVTIKLSSLYPDDELTKQIRACWICHFCFRYIYLLPCPWIRVVQSPTEEEWEKLLDRDKVLLLMNHQSFLDSVLFVAMCPPKVLQRYRTLMKRSLFDAPLLGAVSKAVGHFPVHFVSEHVDEFRVEKDSMKKVMEGLKAHVTRGGCLSIFPEGSINKDPRQLLPFRRGVFSLAIEMNMQVVSLTMIGNSVCWRPRTAFGGYAAQLKLKLSALDTSYIRGQLRDGGSAVNGHTTLNGIGVIGAEQPQQQQRQEQHNLIGNGHHFNSDSACSNGNSSGSNGLSNGYGVANGHANGRATTNGTAFTGSAPPHSNGDSSVAGGTKSITSAGEAEALANSARALMQRDVDLLLTKEEKEVTVEVINQFEYRNGGGSKGSKGL